MPAATSWAATAAASGASSPATYLATTPRASGAETRSRCSWSLFEAALGVRPPHLAAAFGIDGLPLVDASARFIAPARFGDRVELTSQIVSFRRSSFDVGHQLFVSSTLAVEGQETRVWAGRDPADASKLKSQPIPREVIERFQPQ